jgi:hypothetical protein
MLITMRGLRFNVTTWGYDLFRKYFFVYHIRLSLKMYERLSGGK